MAIGSPKLMRFPKGLPKRKQYGERLRLFISQGAQKNTGYSLIGDSIFIGRDDSCDIKIDDAKSSRKHVEIKFGKNQYYIVDQGSANGTLLNNEIVRQAVIKPGDVFIIGFTIFEVLPIPVDDVAAKAAIIAKEAEEKGKLAGKKLVLAAIVIFAVFLVFSSSEDEIKSFRQKAKIEVVENEETTSKKKLSAKDTKAAIKEFMPIGSTNASVLKKDADVFFRIGARELENKNFRRAISSFETALTVDPNHDLVKVYLKRAKKDFQTEIDADYLAGVEARNNLRFKEACVKFQDVMRYLETEPNNKTYEKAKEALAKLEAEEKCPK